MGAIFEIAVNRKDLIRAMLDAGALDIIIRALKSPYLKMEQLCALLAIAEISNEEEQTHRSKEGLCPAIKTCFARFMPKLPKILLCFLHLVVNSDSRSRLFVEWGLAEDLAKYLTRKTVEHDKTCSPAFHALWAWMFETGSKKGMKYLSNALTNGFATINSKQKEGSNEHFKKSRQEPGTETLRNVSLVVLAAVFFNVHGLKGRDRGNKQSENAQVAPDVQGSQDHTDREGEVDEPFPDTQTGAAAQANTVRKPKIVKLTCSDFQRGLIRYRDYLEKRDDLPL